MKNFWSNISVGDGCWNWMRGKDKDGYGKISVEGETVRAHRASWIIHNGPIPDGLQVLHHCDNPSCVRPDHLFVGTGADNMRDKVEKGRHSHGAAHSAAIKPNVVRGDNHPRRKHPELCQRGEQVNTAVLTSEKVVEIRRRFDCGELSQGKLAKIYGVYQTTISRIVRREIWRHVCP